MNTQITIPEIKATPKPTKAQLIDALVEREDQIWRESQKALKAKTEELKEEIKRLAWIEYKKISDSAIDVSVDSFSECVDFNAYISNAKIKDMCNNLKILNRKIRPFNRPEARKTIIAKLAGEKKVNPLLNNPSFNDALDAILTQIKGVPLAITTQEVEVVE